MAPRTLRAEALEAVVDPDRGGSILAFRHAGFDLMRAWDGTSEDPRRFACFPLVPFSGRVDHGRFSFAGRVWQLAPNRPPHAVHGDGFTACWHLLQADEASASLELVHEGPETPFRYRAEQRFTLSPNRLAVALAVTNLGPEAMPFGLGLHPWFDRRPGTLLSAEVGGVWLPDAGNIPRRLEPVPIPWGFRLRRPVDELVLDHNFQGWSGLARIDWPGAGRALEIEADEPFRHLVVYVPENAPFFCVEPVSHVADGFSLLARGVPGTGVRVLDPGERLAGTIRFVLRPGIEPM